METWTISGLSDMGQEENTDSDMGHGAFAKIDMATWAFLKIDIMATWAFLKIVRGTLEPPLQSRAP